MSFLKIQIIRAEAEDLNNSSLGCYVSLNNELLDVVTPLNSQHESNIINVPIKGNLKFFVKTMGDSSKSLGSVTILIEALPSKGYVWLPLSLNPTESILSSIPDDCIGPKILLSLNSDEVKVSEGGLAGNDKVPCEVLINEEMSLRIKELQTQLAEESQSRIVFEQAYLQLQSSINKALVNSQSRESSLIHLLEQKDIEIQRLKIQLEKYESNYKSASEEKSRLEAQIDELKALNFSEVLQRVSQELNETKRLLENSLKQRAYLCGKMNIESIEALETTGINEHERNFIELKAEIIRYDEENKTLRMKLLQSEKLKESLNSQIFELQQAAENTSSKSIDASSEKSPQIDSILTQLGYLGLFKPIKNTYMFGDMMIQILQNNEKLMVKRGNDLWIVEEFVQLSLGMIEDQRTMRANSSRKKFVENYDSEHVKRLSATGGEFKFTKKIPERVLKDRNYRGNSSENRKN